MQIVTDRTFRIAMGFSLFAHGLFFLGWPGNNLLSRKSKRPSLEVTYVKTAPFPQEKQNSGDRDKRADPAPEVECGLEIFPEEVKLIKIRKEPEKNLLESSPGKVEVEEPEQTTAEKKTVSESPLLEGGLYLDYFQQLRELIRSSIRYPRSRQEGEVYLRFVLQRDGQIKSPPLVDRKKSTGSDSLQAAARQGVIAASPFPPFPEGLASERIIFELPIFFRDGEDRFE